MDGL
jgi:hypothetical protein